MISLLAHVIGGGLVGWLVWRISPPTIRGK